MRFLSFLILAAVARADAPAPSSSYLLKPSRVFDGESMHDGWAVVVVGDKIESAGPAAELKAPEAAKVVELPGATLLPGLIEAHSHILLHPYTEASWNDQVARESEALRLSVAQRLLDHLYPGPLRLRGPLLPSVLQHNSLAQFRYQLYCAFGQSGSSRLPHLDRKSTRLN